jgi:hypothetical protein
MLSSFLKCSGQLIDISGTNVIVASKASAAAIQEFFDVEQIFPPGKAIYRVFSGLRLDDKDARFLRGSKVKLAFSSGQELGPESLRYEDFPDQLEVLPLLVYEWHVLFPGNRLSGHASQDWFTNQLSVLIGFARPYQGGMQYGWIRMERETTKPTELIGPNGEVRQVVFLPTAYAVNPFPDRPIRAGEPPELPVLSTEVLRDPSGPTRVRVRWPTGYPGVRLEWALELKALMDWMPVEGVVGEEAIFEVPEDGQLYLRLGLSP